MFDVKNIIADMIFKNEEHERLLSSYDHTDPRSINLLLEEIKDEKLDIDTSALEQYIEEHNRKEVLITDDEYKKVWLSLKEREENPRGYFDSRGRFWVKDSDLVVSIRTPSVKYPYAQMSSARSLKFVKALAQKYKCQNIKELEAVAFSNN